MDGKRNDGEEEKKDRKGGRGEEKEMGREERVGLIVILHHSKHLSHT